VTSTSVPGSKMMHCIMASFHPSHNTLGYRYIFLEKVISRIPFLLPYAISFTMCRHLSIGNPRIKKPTYIYISSTRITSQTAGDCFQISKFWGVHENQPSLCFFALIGLQRRGNKSKEANCPIASASTILPSSSTPFIRWHLPFDLLSNLSSQISLSSFSSSITENLEKLHHHLPSVLCCTCDLYFMLFSSGFAPFV